MTSSFPHECEPCARGLVRGRSFACGPCTATCKRVVGAASHCAAPPAACCSTTCVAFEAADAAGAGTSAAPGPLATSRTASGCGCEGCSCTFCGPPDACNSALAAEGVAAEAAPSAGTADDAGAALVAAALTAGAPGAPAATPPCANPAGATDEAVEVAGAVAWAWAWAADNDVGAASCSLALALGFSGASIHCPCKSPCQRSQCAKLSSRLPRQNKDAHVQSPGQSQTSFTTFTLQFTLELASLKASR